MSRYSGMLRMLAIGAAFFAAGASRSAGPVGPPAIEKLCSDLSVEIKKLKWELEPCREIGWKVGGVSVEGRPLIYAEFGDPAAKNTTLILSMVHGDEVTPLFLGFQLAHWLRTHRHRLPGMRVVVAPLVNPDSFFTSPRQRVNARGVDVNRNLPTRDWNAQALKLWKTKFKSNPRRYPGAAPASEPETVFQQDLIRMTQPQKILSIHAPLNFVDYDGPNHLTLARFPKEYVRECLKLSKRLKATSGGFFPGSLGNYAGQEMGIPTLTLELPSADPTKARRYWNQFQMGIRAMIKFKIPENSATARNQ